MLGKRQDPLAEFVLRHDGPQVAHSLAVFVRVRDSRKRMQPAIVLRQRLNVLPPRIFVVKLGHCALRFRLPFSFAFVFSSRTLEVT